LSIEFDFLTNFPFLSMLCRHSFSFMCGLADFAIIVKSVLI